jgi:hypothetical protein
VQREFRAGDISITPVPDLDEIIERTSTSPLVDGDWYYAPRSGRRSFPSGEITELPFSTRVFGLEVTHVLEHASATAADVGRLEFLVQCFGFFVGMRLSHTEAGFLDATPIKPGTAHDIVWLGASLETAMTHADAFWLRHGRKRPKLVTGLLGVIHNFFLAQNPQLLGFERFIHLYTALEGVHFVHVGKRKRRKTKRRPSHRERIKLLCRAFGMTVPSWARKGSRFNIVDIRNSVIHDGLFLGEPFGFASFHAYPGTWRKEAQERKDRRERARREAAGLLLGMSNLVSRYLIALLEMRPTYLRTKVNATQPHGLAL